jgi:hypothetical protein
MQSERKARRHDDKSYDDSPTINVPHHSVFPPKTALDAMLANQTPPRDMAYAG